MSQVTFVLILIAMNLDFYWNTNYAIQKLFYMFLPVNL